MVRILSWAVRFPGNAWDGQYPNSREILKIMPYQASQHLWRHWVHEALGGAGGVRLETGRERHGRDVSQLQNEPGVLQQRLSPTEHGVRHCARVAEVHHRSPVLVVPPDRLFLVPVDRASFSHPGGELVKRDRWQSLTAGARGVLILRSFFAHDLDGIPPRKDVRFAVRAELVTIGGDQSLERVAHEQERGVGLEPPPNLRPLQTWQQMVRGFDVRCRRFDIF